MLGGKQQLIGVDIGSSSVKMVELKPKKKSYVIKSAIEVMLTPDVIIEGAIMDYGEVVGTVAAAFKAGKFSSKNVATGLKGYSVVAKRISIPLTNPTELRESFIWEAEQYIQMDIEDVSIDYETIKIDEEKGETDILLAAARKDLIVDFKSVIEAAKLKPVIMDLEVFALMNSLLAVEEKSKEPIVIINIGHSTTLIVIVRNGEFSFSYELLKGGRHLIEQISQSLSVSYEEATELLKKSDPNNKEVLSVIDSFCAMLSKETQNIIETFASEPNKVSKGFICGGAAILPGLGEKLSTALDAEVKLFNPFDRMEISGSVDKRLSDTRAHGFAVAVGLALRGAGGKW
jgi:type IV pilus assembly protein PilM